MFNIRYGLRTLVLSTNRLWLSASSHRLLMDYTSVRICFSGIALHYWRSAACTHPDMFSWRHSGIKSWPRKCLDILCIEVPIVLLKQVGPPTLVTSVRSDMVLSYKSATCNTLACLKAVSVSFNQLWHDDIVVHTKFFCSLRSRAWELSKLNWFWVRV